jgi:hypothetical protein
MFRRYSCLSDPVFNCGYERFTKDAGIWEERNHHPHLPLRKRMSWTASQEARRPSHFAVAPTSEQRIRQIAEGLRDTSMWFPPWERPDAQRDQTT